MSDAALLFDYCASFIQLNRKTYSEEDFSKLSEPCKKKIGDFVTTRELIPPLAPIIIPKDHASSRTYEVGQCIKALKLVNNHQLISASDKGVALWDISSMQPVVTSYGQKMKNASTVLAIDEKIIAGVGNMIKIIDKKSGEHICSLAGHVGMINQLTQLSQHQIVSCSSDQTIRIWDQRKQQAIMFLCGHQKSVMSVDAQNQHIVSSSADQTVRLWSVVEKKEEKNVKAHTGPISVVKFLPKEGYVLSGSCDKKAKIWYLPGEKCTKTFTSYSKGCFDTACLVQENIFATGSNDKTVCLWDYSIEKDIPLASLQGHKSHVGAVCFLPNAKILISGSSDKSIRFCNISKILALFSLPLDKKIKLADRIKQKKDAEQDRPLSNDQKLELLN